MAGLNPGLNRRTQLALLRLRGRLTLRQYMREPGRFLGVIIAFAFFVPLALGTAVASAIGYTFLSPAWAQELLGGMLVILWLIWVTYPVLVSSLNEGLDLTRLLVFPIARRDLVVSVLLGTLFDYPTYIMAPVLLAALFTWGLSQAFPLVLLGLILAYCHMVIAGQLVVTVFGGILQSRRFRDLAIILASLFGASCYFIQIGVQSASDRLSTAFESGNIESLAGLRPLDVLQWLPTGAVARAIGLADSGDWGSSLLWLGYSALLLLIFGAAWWLVMQRILTGAGFLLRAPEKKAVARPAAGAPTRARRLAPRGLSWLPADIALIVLKDLRTAWRLPQRRALLLQSLIFPFFMIVPLFQAFGSDEAPPPIVGFFVPGVMLFQYWILSQNTLAWEGRGLNTLLITPIARERILHGKALGNVLLGLPVTLLVTLVGLIAFPIWQTSSALLQLPPAVAILVGVMSLASVLFPSPLNLEAKRGRMSMSLSGGGCLAALGNLIAPLVAALLLAPLVILLVVSALLGLPWLPFAVAPLSWIYGAGVYWLLTRYAARRLAAREPELLEAIRWKGSGEA